MVRFLRARGFSVLQLTWCNLSASEGKINHSHVVLLSQLFTQNEATWLVMHNELCYHNFDIYTPSTLSLLNKPVLSAYLVVHPKWREDIERQGKQVKSRGRSLNLNILRSPQATTHEPKSQRLKKSSVLK